MKPGQIHLIILGVDSVIFSNSALLYFFRSIFVQILLDSVGSVAQTERIQVKLGDNFFDLGFSGFSRVY